MYKVNHQTINILSRFNKLDEEEDEDENEIKNESDYKSVDLKNALQAVFYDEQRSNIIVKDNNEIIIPMDSIEYDLNGLGKTNHLNKSIKKSIKNEILANTFVKQLLNPWINMKSIIINSWLQRIYIPTIFNHQLLIYPEDILYLTQRGSLYVHSMENKNPIPITQLFETMLINKPNHYIKSPILFYKTNIYNDPLNLLDWKLNIDISNGFCLPELALAYSDYIECKTKFINHFNNKKKEYNKFNWIILYIQHWKEVLIISTTLFRLFFILYKGYYPTFYNNKEKYLCLYSLYRRKLTLSEYEIYSLLRKSGYPMVIGIHNCNSNCYIKDKINCNYNTIIHKLWKYIEFNLFIPNNITSFKKSQSLPISYYLRQSLFSHFENNNSNLIKPFLWKTLFKPISKVFNIIISPIILTNKIIQSSLKLIYKDNDYLLRYFNYYKFWSLFYIKQFMIFIILESMMNKTYSLIKKSDKFLLSKDWNNEIMFIVWSKNNQEKSNRRNKNKINENNNNNEYKILKIIPIKSNEIINININDNNRKENEIMNNNFETINCTIEGSSLSFFKLD